MATAYPGGLRKRGGLLDEFMAPDYSYLARRAELTPKQREYAANAPIDFLRGTFAGLLGTPADVANIPQSPMPMEQFGEYSYAPAQKIPYGSEYFLENLPLAPAEDNPLGRVAGQVGSFAPMVPVQAARMAGKGVMAAGRAGERLAERVVPQVMERGGLLGEMVAAMGQGTQSYAYRPTTASKPDLSVGTRYETQQLPGIVSRRPVNWDEMLGGSIMTYPTDMLSRNTLVTSVSDIPLGNNAFVTPGGLMYMMDENNIARSIGYASNRGAATAQNNRALQAIEENKLRGGTGRVFMAPHTMPPGGENFSTGPTLGLLSLIDTTNPSPAILDMISDQMRNATVKKVKGKYKDFVGLNDPKARDQLLTGEGLTAGSPGDLRKIFVDKMSNVGAEKGLGFNYPDLQNAMFDPNVMNRSPFLMGDSIYEALPNLGIRPGTHAAYGYDMPGLFVGNTRGAPISEFMQPLYNQILPTQMNKPGSGISRASPQDLLDAYQREGDPLNLTGVYADPNQLTRGKLSTAAENISMFMDEKEIKRLKKLLGEQ